MLNLFQAGTSETTCTKEYILNMLSSKGAFTSDFMHKALHLSQLAIHHDAQINQTCDQKWTHFTARLDKISQRKK